MISDHCRKPWRKLTELSRRAGQLDAAIAESEQQGNFDLGASNLHKRPHRRPQPRARAAYVWFCLHGVFSTSYLGHRTGFDRWMKQPENPSASIRDATCDRLRCGRRGSG
ncbi:Uncharacterised protein [Raoultella terrigena]|uniref:Uncharacterized protein n=1 Tax=Raoultella terrigena TaxID=577 RepID=A0A4U9D5I7_RAOTE|nr:Uncharacterised protein [Raoultella terrigena]